MCVIQSAKSAFIGTSSLTYISVLNYNVFRNISVLNYNVFRNFIYQNEEINILFKFVTKKKVFEERLTSDFISSERTQSQQYPEHLS